MKSNSSYPILAKEGWGIIGAAIFITLLVWWLIGGFISFIFFVLLVFVIQFFRDPPRAISQTPHSVLSGADGRICKVQKVENPYTGKEEILISTFMNVFNIHSNRSPIGGTVEAIYYKPGKFLNADLDKASMENERNAGLIARRIICHLHIGQEVTRGERFGFIRFGSRVDVYVPLNSEVLVFVGQKVRAADTVLALLNPQEEEKPETPVEAPAVEAVEVTEVAATADAALAAETKTTEEKTQQQA